MAAEPNLKASAIIAELLKLIIEHGDLDCMFYDDCGENEVRHVVYNNRYNAFMLNHTTD